MNLLEMIQWYSKNIFHYTTQMLPCMTVALAAFFLLNSVRRRRLDRLGLLSCFWRESGMLLFVMFCAGLASLTLFPANLWQHVMDYITDPSMRVHGLNLRSFYPSKEELMANTDFVNLFTPFQEIRRTLSGGPWLMFMLLGNIGMFMPIGLFQGLLWRKPRWWKALLLGFGCSCLIEYTQFFVGRSTDIDDVILNTTGALVGYWLFWLLRLLLPTPVKQFQCHEREEPHNGSSNANAAVTPCP